MNQYKISGKLRRDKKKELSLLKHALKNFWFHEDIDRVMGGGHEDSNCQKIINELEEKITQIEQLLREPSTSVVRENKLNELGI
jgi:hypothetical protein